jgi:hypothetical protein
MKSLVMMMIIAWDPSLCVRIFVEVVNIGCKVSFPKWGGNCKLG